MRIMKRFIVFLLIFLNITGFIKAFANGGDIIVNIRINSPMIEVNSSEYKLDDGYTCPVISQGRTLVPVRAVTEAFGGEVMWRESTGTVMIFLDEDVVSLKIGSLVALKNNVSEIMDVAPCIINGRTMIPIRFVSELFNLGVAWNEESQTVTVIKNVFEDDEYERLMNELLPYSGNSYAVINGNVPFFKDYELIEAEFEYYCKTDELSRPGVCMASLGKSLMPTEKRENISHIKPTGWINKSYDVLNGEYLYNRCHLIGFQLTGENDNVCNLITGTSYMNIKGMLPFENKISEYIKNTDNSVMYRVTPVFAGDNLVADGVLMEALSLEDNGEGISICVFCYNVQPGISIDYKTGESVVCR